MRDPAPGGGGGGGGGSVGGLMGWTTGCMSCSSENFELIYLND